MEFLNGWIANIILFVLIATIIDFLLPNSSMHKYTKMVTSLLLMMIIVSPIFKLFSMDIEAVLKEFPIYQEGVQGENLLEIQKKEIQASQHAYILEEMAVHLENEVKEELMEEFNLEIANIEIDLDEDGFENGNINSITVTLKDIEEEPEVVEAVKPVEIDTSEPLPSNFQTGGSEKIAALLSEKWEIQKERIELILEGRGT